MADTILLKADRTLETPLRVRCIGTTGDRKGSDEYGALMASNVFLDVRYIFHATVPADFPLQLKKSLSKTLSSFPTLTGRLDKKTFVCICNNAGIDFSVEQHEGSAKNIEQWPDKSRFTNFPDAKSLRNGEAPLCSVAIHTFTEGGCVIAICISSLIADATTLGMFIDAWGKTHREAHGEGRDEDTLDYEPVFKVSDRSGEDFNDLLDQYDYVRWPWQSFKVKLFANHVSRQPHHKLHRHVIKFTPDQISSLKQAVKKRMKEVRHPDGWVSSNEALASYVNTKIFNLLSIPGKLTENLSLAYEIDCRERCERISKHHFGSAVALDYITNINYTNQWTDNAIKIHDAVRSTVSDSKKIDFLSDFNYDGSTTRGEVTLPRGVQFNQLFSCEKWCNQQAVDLYTYGDFGICKADRVIPFLNDETFKLHRDGDGNVEVHIANNPKAGVGKWIKMVYDTPVKALFRVGVVSTGVGVLATYQSWWSDKKISKAVIGWGCLHMGIACLLKYRNEKKKREFWEKLALIPEEIGEC